MPTVLKCLVIVRALLLYGNCRIKSSFEFSYLNGCPLYTYKLKLNCRPSNVKITVNYIEIPTFHNIGT